MREAISSLNDHAAIKLLSIVYTQKTILNTSPYEYDTLLEFIKDFVDFFKINATNVSISEGEIAKSVLQLLSMDDEIALIIHKNINEEKPSLLSYSYGADFGTFAGGIGIISIALVVLRTYIKFTKNVDGTTKFEMTIKPLSDKQVSEFLQIAKNLASNIIKTEDS